MSELSTMLVPIISMGHLADEEARREDSIASWPSYTMAGEYGYLVYVGDISPDDIETPERWPSLLEVAKWAQAQGYDWVRFDEAGDVVPGLKYYDWAL